MRVGSLFSGVGGFDLGLHRAGHAVAFQVESDPYRRAVLERHWPGVERHDDVRTFDGGTWRGRIDLLAGGFPCQDVSVAGARAGLAGQRSGLFFDFARIADEAVEPGGFLLLENVGGLLTSHNGRDFGVVLATLAEIGFCDLAWRMLDSRYFGVPQRRRRVFILGRRDHGRRCAALLLEPEGGGGDFEACEKTPPRAAHRTRSGIARTVQASQRFDGDTDDFVVANTLKSRNGGGRTNDDAASYWVEDFRNGTLTADPGRTDRKPLALVGPPAHADRVRTPTGDAGRVDDPSVIDPKPDGRRYAAVGDAVTVNVATWIGWRLAMHERGEL